MFAARELSQSFGGAPLLDRAQFTILKGERVALIGRNGEGKSTLMKIICGELKPDAGEFEKAPGLKVSYLPQDIPTDLEGSVHDIVAQGLGPVAGLEKRYHEISLQLENGNGEQEHLLRELSEVQHQLEDSGGWELTRQVEMILEKLGIHSELQYQHLSGGMKRRVILGRELIKEPELLLLDEPTNHLDFGAIAWLEGFLPSIEVALLFVTHDRVFLKNVATRILELDRGKLTSFDCGYDTYLERKEALLEAEKTQNAVFDKKLAQEETWIRQGIKARRTRNEGRVRALQKLREERSQRRELRDGPEFGIQEGQVSGRKVITVANLCYSWDKTPIVKDFSTVIWRGDRIGIIGPNGSGKTTLLQLLLGKLTPGSGTITHGTNLEVVYFDQHREQLDPNLSLKEVVAGDDDHVYAGGQKRHIYSYLSDFMFTPDQARGKVSALSGGETNRLLLAKIFTKRANVLVMDEPTNDLDLETLELLEDLLFDYPSTLLLVSHDRQFLNRVVTQTYALEPDGNVKETVGGYDEYERESSGRRQLQDAKAKALTNPAPNATSTAAGALSKRPEKTRYRTNREHWELEDIPGKIEVFEARQNELAQQLSASEVVSDPIQLQKIQAELDSIEIELNYLMERWEELEAIPLNPSKAVPDRK